MERFLLLLALASVTALSACGSTPLPPPQTPANEAATMQELDRETAQPQPAPQPYPRN